MCINYFSHCCHRLSDKNKFWAEDHFGFQFEDILYHGMDQWQRSWQSRSMRTCVRVWTEHKSWERETASLTGYLFYPFLFSPSSQSRKLSFAYSGCLLTSQLSLCGTVLKNIYVKMHLINNTFFSFNLLRLSIINAHHSLIITLRNSYFSTHFVLNKNFI